MSGFETYQRWQRIENQANMLGFQLSHPKNGRWASDDHMMDQVALYPGDKDALPIYSRDAELFVGTFAQVEIFLQGWARSQQYDFMLRMSDEKKRKKYEDKERERQRIAKEKEEQRKMYAILADKSAKEVEKLIK